MKQYMISKTYTNDHLYIILILIIIYYSIDHNKKTYSHVVNPIICIKVIIINCHIIIINCINK